MTVIRFPARDNAIWMIRDAGDGIALVLRGPYGWDFVDTGAAMCEARQLAREDRLSVRVR